MTDPRYSSHKRPTYIQLLKLFLSLVFSVSQLTIQYCARHRIPTLNPFEIKWRNERWKISNFSFTKSCWNKLLDQISSQRRISSFTSCHFTLFFRYYATDKREKHLSFSRMARPSSLRTREGEEWENIHLKNIYLIVTNSSRCDYRLFGHDQSCKRFSSRFAWKWKAFSSFFFFF